LRPSDLPLSADIDAAMRDAKTTMFELDMETLTSADTAAKMRIAQQLEGDKALSELLPLKTRDKLEAMLKVGGGTLAQVDRVDPWALSLSFSIGAMAAMGFNGDHGPDRQLSQRAKTEGKPRIALETLDDELAAFDRQPLTEQLVGLGKFVDDPKTAIDLGLKMHAAWMAGDAQALTRDYLEVMAKEQPESFRLLLVDRNNAWMPKLQARLDQHRTGDNTLAVVGALHLLGNDGLVEQLRTKGYRVERICTDCTVGQR
jgi:uncharacterized protein